MNKFDLKCMASALAAAHNISEADAEKFLKVVCDVVVDALRHDGQVKIKGLGTFKLIGVPEREMFDVNSGERIIVEARNRISFSPDAVLRDIINKPFVFFDTVVLNEGVVFDDEAETDTADDDDDQDIEDNRQEDLAQDEEIVSEDVVEPVVEPVSEVHTEETPEEQIPQDEETSSAAQDTDVQTETAETEPLEDTPIEEAEVHETEETPEEETKQSEAPQAVNDALSDARSIMDDIQSGNLNTEEEDDDDEEEGNFFTRHLLTIFLVIVIIVGGGAFVYGLYGNEIMSYLGYGEKEEQIAEIVEEKPVVAIADSLKTDSIKKDTLKKDTITAPKVENKKEVYDPAYYDSLDIRVRTGAYMIIGLDTAVKVRSGQTLRSIARSYLGDGMECYVEVFNGVKSVKPGDTLKIPKLKWKKKRKR